MKIMKKFISVLVSVLLSVELTSCSNNSSKDLNQVDVHKTNTPSNINGNDSTSNVTSKNSQSSNNNKNETADTNSSNEKKSMPSNNNINNTTFKNNKKLSHSSIFDKNKAIEIAMHKYGSSPNLEYALIDYGTENSMKYYNLVVKETPDGQVKSTVIDNIKVFEDGTIKVKGGLIIK